MKIVVVGCGKIGRTIIDSLVKEKHDVLAIDTNPEVLNDVTNVYDVMGICGNGTEYEKLKEADVQSAELFIAVTSSDEINMLSCFAAKRMGAKYTVARIRNTENNDNVSLHFMRKQLDLSIAINPELQTARSIFNVLKLPSATKVEMLGNQSFDMFEMTLKEDSALDGLSLIELRRKVKEKFLICTVLRGEEAYIPQGNFRLKSGDRIGVIASGRDTLKILRDLNIAHRQIRNVMIMGAGKTSYYLSKMLVDAHIGVKVIEIDKKHCEEFCEVLPEATVIHGSGMDQDLLREEGLASADAFVALTGRDEENILISFYARSQNTPKVICKVNDEELSAIAGKLGLDSIVSPKKITADILVRYARALRNSEGSKMETLYSLMNGKAEALEFNVLPDFEFAGIPLKDIEFLPDVLVAGIVRGRESILPSGSDVILPGDRVIVIANGGQIYDLASIARRSGDK
ncbi:MAG: Trk system potassium transporter TrkA [Clostridia bacterium]|nr:Trk system potassium transporter TrkA [Clostridia bacterium]